MLIEVTNEDIDKGKIRQCEFCPVALAIKRCLNENDVTVGETVIYVGDKKVDMPDVVQKFVIDSDCRDLVEPFSFELDIK